MYIIQIAMQKEYISALQWSSRIALVDSEE